MANIGLVSPGVKVTEVDLTKGGIRDTVDNVAAIAIPAPSGPVNIPYMIENEEELFATFGAPDNTDYAYWLTAASYLSYGGRIKALRCDDATLRNANIKPDLSTNLTTLKIKNADDFNDNFRNSTTFAFSARTPGTLPNGAKVCVIDYAADQILNVGSAVTSMIASNTIRVGFAITQALAGDTKITVPTYNKKGKQNGTIQRTINGYLQAIITGYGYSTINVKITNWTDELGKINPVSYTPKYSFKTGTATNVGYGTTGTPATGISILSSTSTADTPKAGLVTCANVISPVSWWDSQTLGLSNNVVYWNQYVKKPGSTSAYGLKRSSSNDLFHIIVIDDNGNISNKGAGAILSIYKDVSKASDNPNWYVNVVNSDSNGLIYAGQSITGFLTASNFQGTLVQSSDDRNQSLAFTPVGVASGIWNQTTQGTVFSVVGNRSLTLRGGVGYGATVDYIGLSTSYSILISAKDEQINFILGGPGADGTNYDSIILNSQTKASHLIAVAEDRADCIACVSPPDICFTDAATNDAITENIVDFYEEIQSSSYAVFDSGSKYMYDKYNNVYRWVPTNGDVAGVMAKSIKDSYAWYSPAGPQRGIFKNVTRLRYSPSQDQRDDLYSARINPIITTPGTGTYLFGDKTALSYPSAFDRINVRRLFLLVEDRIERFSQAQLFEFNDEVTRSNFRNQVEPYLRDIQAKRGIKDFVVICDDSNNTPDVIDANEFKADIFIQPARSINYIGLQFIATRTGVSFAEVVGTV